MLNTELLKTRFCLAVLLSSTLLTTCQSVDEVAAPEGEGRILGFIQGVISDARTNAPIVNANVYYKKVPLDSTQQEEKVQTVISDTLGIYSIPALMVGNYVLVYERLGYTRVSSYLYVDDPTGTFDIFDEEDFHVSVVKSVSLFPKDATVTGTIYLGRDPENTIRASGAEIVLDVDPTGVFGIIRHRISSITDTDGKFTMIDIPAVPSANYITLPFIDSLWTYGSVSGSVSLSDGGGISLGSLLLTIAPDIPLVTQNNLQDGAVKVDQKLSLIFSKAIDITTVNPYLQGPWGVVDTRTSWDAAGIELTITPTLTLSTSSDYDLSIEGRSRDGNYFIYYFEFDTEEGIGVLSINLVEIDGLPVSDFEPAANIEIEFSQQADPSASMIHLEEQSTGRRVATTLIWSADSLKLTVDPLSDLMESMYYRLYFDPVRSTILGDMMYDSYSYKTASLDVLPGAVMGLTADGTSIIDWNTTVVHLTWDALTGVDDYVLFARDNKHNPAAVAVDAVPASDYLIWEEHWLSLPDEFDAYRNDATQTPFSAGTHVEVMLAARNEAGMGPLSDPLTLKDVVPPTIDFINQQGTAFNSDSLNIGYFNVAVGFTEYCDPNDEPLISFTEAGGDSGFVFLSTAASWKWDADVMSGTITVEIPPGADGRGDLLIIRSAQDNSGNIATSSGTFLLWF